MQCQAAAFRRWWLNVEKASDILVICTDFPHGIILAYAVLGIVAAIIFLVETCFGVIK